MCSLSWAYRYLWDVVCFMDAGIRTPVRMIVQQIQKTPEPSLQPFFLFYFGVIRLYFVSCITHLVFMFDLQFYFLFDIILVLPHQVSQLFCVLC